MAIIMINIGKSQNHNSYAEDRSQPILQVIITDKQTNSPGSWKKTGA